MKKKIVWLVVSCLMVLSLVLASCGPAEVEEEEVAPAPEVVEEEVVPPEEEVVVEEVAPAPEEPKYGGVLKLASASSPQIFDDAMGFIANAGSLMLTNEDLFWGDWAKGPQGSGEISHMYVVPLPLEHLRPILAESWELADADTLVLHIREGVYWHDKPPANRRQLDANDVAFSLNRIWDSPRSYHAYGAPKAEHIESITATDKWTVVFKAKPGRLGDVFTYATQLSKIFPREVGEQNIDVNQWENSIGTGPFLLVDFVNDSSETYVRNPSYWDKHPLYPEDTMPYLDGIKRIIIPDKSTRIAALRTGKVDHLSDLSWEDVPSLKKTNPELLENEYQSEAPTAINWRVDKPELPWYDVNVRHALWLAINNQEIVDSYYGGHAELFGWPFMPILEFQDLYTPLEEYPELVQELYGYNPDKAKQLLAEAGYPEGFKAEIVLQQTQVDLLLIAQAYWADVGVNLELRVVESGVYSTIQWTKGFKEMFAGIAHSGNPFKPIVTMPGYIYNNSIVNDPKINELTDAVGRAFFDRATQVKLTKEIAPYKLEQAFWFTFPAPYSYTFWQPWLKGYSGELHVGYLQTSGWPMYVWLDQDLKEEMTGRR